MLLTDYLSTLGPAELYAPEVLDELQRFGIFHDGGVLTSRRTDERPYPSFGRCASVRLMTKRQLTQAALKLGRRLDIDDPQSDVLLAPGYEIVTACWRLLRPVVEGAAPPSALGKTAEEKALFDLIALRRYGY